MVRHLVGLAHKAAHPLPPSRDERAAADVWLRLDVHEKAFVLHKAKQRRLFPREYLAHRIRYVAAWKRRKESNSGNSGTFPDRSRQPTRRPRI